MAITQWRVLDGGTAFTVCEETTGEITPGVYELAMLNGAYIWMRVPSRTDDIIQFPETPVNEVVAEIQRFWEQEETFRRHGLPHKRGILLHGPPGSGKTCTLELVARDVVERDGIVLLFDSPTSFSAAYRQLRMVQPETPLVVMMEDLDEILDGSNQSSVLNLLDGVSATHKVVFLATTNYARRLDPRIVNRPSRFDRRFLIKHPNAVSRRMYLERMIRPGDDIDLDRYAADTDEMSLAHVKELFVSTVLLGTDYGETIRSLRAMKDKPQHDDGTTEFRAGTYA